MKKEVSFVKERGVGKMQEYQLSDELNESIVDGIIEGYRDYLDVRRQKARELKVHGSYAWVRGNHIDHYVALACEEHGVTSSVAKAGLTWQYLQFTEREDRILFIVKNARYFNVSEVDKGRDAKGQTRSKKASYMNNLISINRDINFRSTTSKNFNSSVQLELLEDFSPIRLGNADTIGVDKQFDRFYIATYNIDANYQIREISLWMPNPSDNRAYLISDLTSYIGQKPGHVIEIEDDLKTILTQTVTAEDILDATEFGIVIDDEKAQES